MKVNIHYIGISDRKNRLILTKNTNFVCKVEDVPKWTDRLRELMKVPKEYFIDAHYSENLTLNSFKMKEFLFQIQINTGAAFEYGTERILAYNKGAAVKNLKSKYGERLYKYELFK